MRRTSELPERPPPVVGFGDRYDAGFTDASHRHDRGQLSIVLAGTVTIGTDDARFVLGPQQAAWIPPGTSHGVTCRTAARFQAVYLDPAGRDLPPTARMFEATALLRGLVDEIVAMRLDFTMDERMGLIARLLVGEIGRAPRTAEAPPLPTDYRLRRVCEAIVADPGNGDDIDHWAKRAGMARRSFTRLFRVELGMGFAAWRRRVRVTEAAARIAAGRPIAEVAFDLGYDNASSFSMMFHRTFGAAPRTLRGTSAGGSGT